MATRRQPTQRLLAGRNAANPVEMASNFDLNVNRAQGVGGVMRAAAPQGNIGDSSLAVLNGLAEWGSKKIREAAKRRYETLAMEGAVAFQQGKAIDDLPMDGNKWMLEGYRTMEAETISAALTAAQQEEIRLSLHEQDPDAFRSKYTARLNEALAGKDERTQEMIKKRMLEQMPSLVAQHTREHAQYQEGQNYDALTSSIDVMSRDPGNTGKLVEFALGGAGSEGLSEERRQAAVVDGVVRAYANDNPIAYSVLEAEGVFDNLNTQEINAIRSAQAAYESRVRSTYDETRFNEERALIDSIEKGALTPEEAVLAWAEYTTRHGLTMSADEASRVADAAEGSNREHTRAIALEIETAKINGDYDRVADLSYQYADRAANPGTPGTIYEHNTTIEYQMGPKRPNKPSAEIQSVIGRAAEDVFGPGARIVITSGKEDEGKQHGSHRHKTGNAADFAVYRPDGSRVTVTEEAADEFAVRAAELGVSGIGYGSEYMGDNFHFDLVGTKVVDGDKGGHYWASGATANKDNIVAAIGRQSKTPSMGPVDAEKWKTLVDYYEGDLELAAVAYTTDTLAADTWNTLGRDETKLRPETAAFLKRLTGGISGERYVTSSDRLAAAEEAYSVAREAAAVDVYSVVAPQIDALGKDYVAGRIDQQTYADKTAALRDQWGLATTKADVDQMIALGNLKQEALDKQALDRKNEDYSMRVGQFSVEREAADLALIDAIEAITTSEKPEGVSDSAFLKSQQEAIMQAQTTHQQTIKATAAAYGIEWKDSAAVETAKKGINQVREGFAKATENMLAVAQMERAVATGTLGSQPKAIQDRAYEVALSNISASTERFATSPKKDGSMPTQDEVAAFQQSKIEDWFAKTNFVPAQVRNEFSSVVTGQLVTPDGVVSQHALDAITAYATLKQKSPVAADKLLDPQAKVIAEAALSTAGSPDALPRVLLDMWAQGLNSPFTGKPSPNFSERSDVQALITDRIAESGIYEWVFGETPLQSLALSTASRDNLKGVLEAQIQKLHSLNPNLNPKYILALAENAVLDSAVPIETSEYGMFGSASGEHTLLVDPTGGNIMEQMFGAQAPSYMSDRLSVSKAITGYLSSDEFKSRYGDMTPSMGVGEMVVATLPFTDNNLLRATNHGLPVFTAQHVGNGKLYLDFTLDSDGTTRSIVLPLEEAGAWYKNNLQGELTK